MREKEAADVRDFEVLDPGGIEEAKTLFVREIDVVRRKDLDDANDEIACVNRWMMSATGRPAPADTWLGVRNGDGGLIAAVHAAPHYVQALQMLHVSPPELGPSPTWMIRFLDTVASVEEVAVAREHRREGHGRALVAALLRALRHRRVRHVSGAATSPAAIELFRDAGFTIGGYHQPVPVDYAAGCLTLWWDALPDDVRYFWAHLTAPGFRAPSGR
jgi:GNAT superfamily N-acetyltransferase